MQVVYLKWKAFLRFMQIHHRYADLKRKPETVALRKVQLSPYSIVNIFGLLFFNKEDAT